MDDWRQILISAVNTTGSKADVAKRMNVSRTYVSRVLSGHIAPVSPVFVERVLETFAVVNCPATGQQEPRSKCRTLAQAAAPTHNPAAMRLWKTCRQCPHRPEKNHD